ncbi:hypothetical protein CN539_00695 [Bacillus toyonensis]|uniref:hypothetical protein n=1 Tax=Bacillus toyonensis TaxID=155322 RepID=UPI000BF0055B|nr:hypothetical protein [Bacillus toyonensis]PEN77540.1 hypothetical protein CN539_00695 [Bacillus toyonensis]
MNTMKAISVYGFVPVAIILGTFFLLKHLFLHVMKRWEEDHKSELRAREDEYKSKLKNMEADFKLLLDKQIEEHKSELKKINDKYQIKFSKLHADRAVIIKDLYSKLVTLESNAKDLLGPNGSINQSIPRSRAPKETAKIFENLRVSTADLLDCYMKNKIYFSEEVCKLFEDITYGIPTIAVQFLSYMPSKGVQVQEEAISVEKKEKEDRIVADYVYDEMPKIKVALEAEFRELLGVIEV